METPRASLTINSDDIAEYITEANGHAEAIQDILGNLTVLTMEPTPDPIVDTDGMVAQATQLLTTLETMTTYIPSFLRANEDTELPPQTIAGDKQPLSATRLEILPKPTRRDHPAPITLDPTFAKNE